MEIIIVVVAFVVTLIAGRVLERRFFGSDSRKKERFRRRVYAHSLKAAAIVVAVWGALELYTLVR